MCDFIYGEASRQKPRSRRLPNTVVIYCCVTNEPQTHWLATLTILSHSFSGLGSGNGLAGWFWLVVAVKMASEVTITKEETQARGTGARSLF